MGAEGRRLFGKEGSLGEEFHLLQWEWLPSLAKPKGIGV